MKLSSIIWTNAEHARRFDDYLEHRYKPSNYVRNRLGDLATIDDAKRWALILYYAFFESTLLRAIPCFFRDDKWLDIFPDWSTAVEYFIRYQYKEKAFGPMLGLLSSDDERLVIGALLCLKYLDQSILKECRGLFITSVNGIRSNSAKKFAMTYLSSIVDHDIFD